MHDALQALADAVEVAPDDAPLRLQYARLLLASGRAREALTQASAALRLDPADARALDLVTEAASAIEVPAPGTAPGDATIAATPESEPEDPGIDWDRMETEVGVALAPPFVDGRGGPVGSVPETPRALPAVEPDPGGAGLIDVPREVVTFTDVAGLDPIKHRIREAFLDPMRHPEIARAFGATLRGGLLLYGPPGVGKTYLARAIAGELGARFLTLTLADVLDRWFGQSERSLHDFFQEARRLAPAVVFLDEVDAIGGKRAHYASSGMRTIVNQLLQEMDGIGSENDGLFVLAATNHPWDVDGALLRPGRLDRTVLVLPPDAAAREAILWHHLRGRPVAGIDLAALAARTEHFSGADLAHVVATSAEKSMAASIESGQVRPITMAELTSAVAEIRPSTTSWFHSARNVVTFANRDGRYDDLAAYLRARKML